MKDTPADQPPPYDLPAEGSSHNGPSYKAAPVAPKGPAMPSTSGYHYTNPVNQDHIISMLPPDHPQMICLQQGSHVRETKFGILGIIAAVVWFPLGIALCLIDRRVRCKRCGMILQDHTICA